MVELRLGDQVFLHDREATLAAYALLERGYADICGCEGCRNFAAQRATVYPPDFLALLDRLGIDPLKEGEAVHYGGVPPGLHAYGGWFYFIGSLLTPGERLVEVKGGSFWVPAAHKTEERGFFYYVGTLTPQPPPSFLGKPVLALEFETRLPWVLAEPGKGPREKGVPGQTSLS
jgi:hypothetical protein